MNIVLGATIIILFALAVMESPYFFRYHSLRFIYKSGLLLYSRTFKVQAQANKFNIPRWKIEHWMVASGFSSGLSSPMAEEDGEARYIFAEFVYPLFSPTPLLMRGKIFWDNKERNVVVRGYATWSYFSILLFAVMMLFIPSKVEGNMCGGIIFLFIFCGVLWFMFIKFHTFNLLAQKLQSIYLQMKNEGSAKKYRARNGWLTQRAPDVWEFARFRSIFLASSFSCSQTLSTPAHTQVTQTVRQPKCKSKCVFELQISLYVLLRKANQFHLKKLEQECLGTGIFHKQANDLVFYVVNHY